MPLRINIFCKIRGKWNSHLRHNNMYLYVFMKITVYKISICYFEVLWYYWPCYVYDLSRGFYPTMVYVCYGSVTRGLLPLVLDSYVRTLTLYIIMMIMGYAVQYVCFTKRKMFCEIFSFTYWAFSSQKIIYCVVGKSKGKAYDV